MGGVGHVVCTAIDLCSPIHWCRGRRKRRGGFFAHVGGFVFGMLYTWIFMKLVPQPPVEQRREVLYERAERYRF